MNADAKNGIQQLHDVASQKGGLTKAHGSIHNTLTKAEVEAYVAQGFVKKALKTPSKVYSVLSFFFGVDYEAKNYVEEMRNGNCLQDMSQFWFRSNEEYDKICREHFSEVVEAAGKGDLKGEEDWNETVDGKMAQIILCDQLSRNCFRGTAKAFSFDSTAQGIAREIVEPLVEVMQSPAIVPSVGPSIESLKGEFYPPYIAFLITTLMHSENMEDHHDLCQKLLQRAVETSPPHLHVYFEGEEMTELERKKVLERFGRYPHRNKILGRENTPEEEAWLSNEDNLPRWAKTN